MKGKKGTLQKITYVLILLAAIVLLFHWHSANNSKRMEERNKNYAEDSARLKVVQINDELKNAKRLVNAYTYFLGESLTETSISAQMLKEMEANSRFDALLFTDLNGMDYASDGRTSDVTDRSFYTDGIGGNSGISIIFEPHLFDETMACFYAPVYSGGEIIGVLRGAYLAEEYLKNMLHTTYFGEEAGV